MKTIEEMKIVLINSSENNFIDELENYDIIEQDKFGNDIVHYFINHTKDIKIDFNKIMDILLRKGLSINTKQKTGKFKRSYLQLSVIINNRNVFEYLMGKGADVNAIDINGNSIISDAVMNYYKDKENYEYYIIKLLEKGADPKIKNNYGINAIELANSIANYNVKKYFNGI